MSPVIEVVELLAITTTAGTLVAKSSHSHRMIRWECELSFHLVNAVFLPCVPESIPEYAQPAKQRGTKVILEVYM